MVRDKYKANMFINENKFLDEVNVTMTVIMIVMKMVTIIIIIVGVIIITINCVRGTCFSG